MPRAGRAHCGTSGGDLRHLRLRLNLRLTHQEIASALSTTRVTITRVIGLLRDEGWLKIDSERHLVITHLPRP